MSWKSTRHRNSRRSPALSTPKPSASTLQLAREASSHLARAEQLFKLSHEETTLTSMRVAELFTETRSWLGEYLDELERSTGQSDRSAEGGTEDVADLTVGLGKGADQGETGSPEGSR